jgi:hypothetical protein
MKQFGEEIGDEERIGKDQCPKDYSFKTNLNLSSLFCFLNPQYFFATHLSSHRQFCKKEQICEVIEVIYLSSNRFFTIFKNAKPPKMIRQIINKLDRANSLIIELIPHSF